jgi:hypothetical protein
MTRQALLLSGSLALVAGCIVQVPAVLDAGEDGDGETESSNDEETTDTGDDPIPDMPVPDPDPDPVLPDGDGCVDALDILVVMDNSGSMGEEQVEATYALPELLNGLDQQGVDWRLAVTTTDNGNPWCPAGSTTPEGGSFVFSSCQTRLGDFVFGNDVDVQELACDNLCFVSDEQLEAQPTFTDFDGLAKPRPWLQREAGQLNVAANDIFPEDAIRCLLPQGINGCGFEQPLESMWKALARTQDPTEPEAGFLRNDASLLVVIITDETDCSHRIDHDDIFEAEGNKAFWSDPSANFPTSALCWNAGIECTGDPNNYDDCVAVNKNESGELTGPANAVLHPVSRYINTLKAIEASKKAIDPGLDVAVLTIAGVGLDGTLTFADVTDTDPAFQDSFGIGPGCTAPNPLDPNSPRTAVPPGRMREVAEGLTTNPFASICADEFDQFMLDALAHFVGEC